MIKTTSNYTLFSLMEQNRDVDLGNAKVKKLAGSMAEYGWLDSFPLMAKQKGGKLIVVDGQHRLAIASEYGIPVKYVIETQDVDVARLNDTSHSWTLDDFANKYAKAGSEDYQELLDFSAAYGISVAMSAAILANRASNGVNAASQIKAGTWRIKTRSQAYALGNCYQQLCGVNEVFKKSNAVKVLWACFQIPYFESKRLILGAKKRSAEIKSFTKIDMLLDAYEEIYNFGKQDKRPLKFDAEQAMKNRSPIGKTKSSRG